MSMNMKEIEFPTASYDQWKEEAIKALKGKPFESLFTKTIEGITLEPLYTQESLVEKLGEQLENQVATIRSLSATNGLEVAQQVYGSTKEAFIENLEESLARGNEVITIANITFEIDDAFLATLADYLTEYSFKLIVEAVDAPVLAVFNKIEESKRAQVEGYIVAPSTVTLADYPKVRTFSANTVPYHNEGADIVQELAIALSLAAKYAKESENYEAFANKFFVNFALDTQFFPEIAKIRAFKVLWKAFSSAFGTEAIAVPIVAETSVRSFSKVDVYVNLLRAGNEAFSGAIGGVDVLTVHPHDALSEPTAQSVRIARNVLLVTKEESLVLNVLDPAGGSYFIESLTADYVKLAWEKFLEIEDAGGIDAYAAKLNEQIEAVYNERIKHVETRKASLIGTNIYANPADELPIVENAQFADVKRLATPFENLRKDYATLNAKIGILTYGELKNFKPRADYVAGVLATAAVVAEKSPAFTNVADAQAWLKDNDFNYVIVAATDDDTKAIIPALLEAKPEGLVLDAAGKYKEDQDAWTEAGLNGFVFAGQNIVEKLVGVAESLKEVRV